MTQATHWFGDTLIDYNQSQDTGMMIIKIPSWKYFELKSQAQELENQLNKSSFGKGQEWEHKNMIANDDTKVSVIFLENTPTSYQTEISDEEIEKGADKFYPYDELLDDGLKGMIISAKKGAWFDAIKWYREQLKQRQF